MSPQGPVILWFRQDLRLDDNPALAAALATGRPLLPVYILEEDETDFPLGGASRWWLHHSLASLAASLEARGSRLLLRQGEACAELERLARESAASGVYWNRRYEPAARARDARTKEALRGAGLEVRSFNGALLFEPHTIQNKQGRPFQVFTPYWRHCLALGFEAPVESLPSRQAALPAADSLKGLQSLPLASLQLLPRIPWDVGFADAWHPGEKAAQERLRSFFKTTLGGYAQDRDIPSIEGVSRLSPHLHFGEIGPRRIVASLRQLSAESGVFPADKGSERFIAELGWREFAHHLLHHFPETTRRPLRPDFERFPWAEDPEGKRLRAWQRGRTGYPIVDAGMRQLWQTGWMHNRVRMIVASFLVKHLRLPWQQGAAWFWDTLVDADLAANTLGWQWSAGCGADAAPYFRIFNPTLQGEKFDPEGTYVRRWVPELAHLPASRIHRPWDKGADELLSGRSSALTYPRPVVDHTRARTEALAALSSIRKEKDLS